MGTDSKKLNSLMGDIFGDEVVKVDITMEQAGKITQGILSKALNPEVGDDEAVDVIKRGRAFVEQVSNQDGIVKKTEEAEEEVTYFSIEKALVKALLEDIKDVEVEGTWASNVEDLRARFSKKTDGDKDKVTADKTDGDRKSTEKAAKNKDAGDKIEPKSEEEVWGTSYDLNIKKGDDEDWGADPAESTV